MTFLSFYSIAYYLLFVSVCECQQLTEYEIENSLGKSEQGRIGVRQKASGGRMVYTRQGDKFTIKLCPSKPVGIYIDGIVYSNDGQPDQVEVMLDKTIVGSFKTEQTPEGTGKYWNEYKSSGQIGNLIPLSDGKHTLELTVKSADYYGTELDKIVIRTDSNIDESSFWCRETDGQTSKQSDTTPPTQKETSSSSEAKSTTTSSSTTTTSATSSSSATTSLTAASAGIESPEALPAKTEVIEKVPFIEQLSFPSKCLDIPNVRVKFNPTTLKGVEIITRASEIDRKAANTVSVFDKGTGLKTCKTTLWQIGEADGKLQTADTPSQDAVIDYTVSTNGGTQANFPMTINPGTTQKIKIHHSIPSDLSLEHNNIYFTIGLVNVEKETDIGIQYVDSAKLEPSNIQYLTFKPNQRVIGWALPVQATPKLKENKVEIHIIFDAKLTGLIKFDFLRLDITPQDEQLKNVFLFRHRVFSIKGKKYKNLGKDPSSKGMVVGLDARKENKNFAKVIISNKRRLRRAGLIWNMLTVTDEGKLYPLHENHLSLKAKKDAEGKTFNDISGVILGDPNNPVAKVWIVRKRSEITITYADSTYVRMIYRAENGRTRLIITESTLKQNSIEFISTFVTDNMAGVNSIVVDSTSVKPIMDNLSDVKGQQFVFIKTSPNPMFQTSTNFGILFPQNVIPK